MKNKKLKHQKKPSGNRHLKSDDVIKRQNLFVDFYIQTRNQTLAAELAGYSRRSAKVQGHRLLTNDNLRKKIVSKLERVFSRENINSEDIISQLSKIAFSDIGNFVEIKNGTLSIHNIQDLPPQLTCTIESITKKADGSKSIKLFSKIEALKQLIFIYRLADPNVDGEKDSITRNVFIIPGFDQCKFPDAPVSKEIIERDRKAKEEHERNLKDK